MGLVLNKTMIDITLFYCIIVTKLDFSQIQIHIGNYKDTHFKAVVGGPAGSAMAGPFFWPKMVSAGPQFSIIRPKM